MKIPNKLPYKKAMDSSAPGAIDAADMMDGTPSAGTTAPAGKSTDPGPFKYRFSTKTAVTQAPDVPGACQKAVDIQEGCNKSKLLPSAPPSGSSAKDGEETKFESGVIGTS